MGFKISIALIIAALLTLLVGFSAFMMPVSEKSQTHVYGFCDSLAWTTFSTAFYLIAIEFYKQRKIPIVKLLRKVCEIFMLLSICPLINEIYNIADKFQYNNYVYGICVLLFYLGKYFKSLTTNE